MATLDAMSLDPYGGNSRKLEGFSKALPLRRRRVGSWRIFFWIDDVERVVNVTHIQRRTSTTYRKR